MTEIKRIKSAADIDEALSRKCAVVFKHSTRCGISARAKQELDTFAETCGDDTLIYMVDVIGDRNLSEEIAKRTGVQHDSPQALFIIDGKVKSYKTHFDITQISLLKGVSEEVKTDSKKKEQNPPAK